MTAVIANLKKYLNACLRFKKYDEYKPDDQLSSVVASWLRERQYKDYYVYLVWFAMREILLQKFKNDTIKVVDVVKTFMEYPDMFVKMLDVENPSDIFADKMWLCRLCDDHFVHIYKIMSVARIMQHRYVRSYGKPEFLALLPDNISAHLDNNDIHQLKIMPKDEMMSKIILFLRASLKDKRWFSIPYDNQYMINLYDLVMFECESLEYSDANVQKIWYSVKIIIKYEHEILTTGFMPKGSVQLFSDENPKLFELMGHDHCFHFGKDVGTDLFNMFKRFIELNDDKITINLPDFIECIANKQENKSVRKINDEEKLNLCKEFFKAYQRLPKHNEVYKNFNIGNFIARLKHGKNSQLKSQVEEIFQQEINSIMRVVSTHVNYKHKYEYKHNDVNEDVLELTKKLLDLIHNLRVSENKYSENEITKIKSAVYDLNCLLK